MNKNNRLTLKTGVALGLLVMASTGLAAKISTSNPWSTACKANGSGQVVTEKTSVSNVMCSNLLPNGALINNQCQNPVYPAATNCSTAFYSGTANPNSSNPAATILQCSEDPVQGPPSQLFKYVLCKSTSGSGYYWSRLVPNESESYKSQFSQSPP